MPKSLVDSMGCVINTQAMLDQYNNNVHKASRRAIADPASLTEYDMRILDISTVYQAFEILREDVHGPQCDRMKMVTLTQLMITLSDEERKKELIETGLAKKEVVEKILGTFEKLKTITPTDGDGKVKERAQMF